MQRKDEEIKTNLKNIKQQDVKIKKAAHEKI